MIVLDMTPLTFLAALVVGHCLNLLAEWGIHAVQHRRVLGLALDQLHRRAHHHPASELPSLWDKVMGHLVWAGMIGAMWILYLVFLAPWIAWTFIALSVALVVFDYVTHAAYVKPHSPLRRFEWFRRSRRQHALHHRVFQPGCNFGFGGPLAGMLADRVMGTFRDMDAARRPR